MTVSERRYAGIAALIAAVAVVAGIAFRFHGAAAYPLWLDEAYSAFAGDHSFAWIWRMVPQYETHPPVYYSMVRLWGFVTGDSVIARRLLGLLCGLATVAVAGVATDRLGRILHLPQRGRVWLVAGVVTLVALQPLLVGMSRQLRPYPVMILVYALSLLPLLRLLADSIARRPLGAGAVLGFFVCEALMLWLHSLGPLFGLAMTLSLAVAVLHRGLSRRDWAWLVVGQGLVGLLYLPAFLIMLHQARTWVKTGWVVFDIHDVPLTIAQIWLDWNAWACLIGFALVVTGLLVLSRRARGGRPAAILLLMAVLPVLLSVILSATVSPVFLARTLSPTAVPALMLVGLGLCWPGRGAWAALAGFVLVAASMAWIDRELAKAGPPQDWRAALAWLEPRVAPGDIVWAYPNEGALPLAYALQAERHTLPWRQVPAPVPALGLAATALHPTGGMGAVSLYPAQIDTLMRTAEAKRPPTIWLLRLSPELYDKDDTMLHALERERVEVGAFRSRQIDLIGLRRKGLPPVAAAQQAQP
ncbi:hypothetical protein HZF05_14870 [Sphingomonas sp. CGMCC 1.13654]|uniref:Glycosyltransferase RgtA/B/C/D-like domain-containing protein n=1 Tax=Sphingomonas chungangi TaxID=2683589 RepID=A0A838L8L4_9SPHN|nr:hypothetical protein [Sphingomonas chungangi]MBA2935367.1 hypothetical protein [Sphingomonas chungangi]MVW56873.1 hypothetical protein [Sphingomonas chungangi]